MTSGKMRRGSGSDLHVFDFDFNLSAPLSLYSTIAWTALTLRPFPLWVTPSTSCMTQQTESSRQRSPCLVLAVVDPVNMPHPQSRTIRGLGARAEWKV